MTAVIQILSGDLEGRAYDIDEAPFTIGRKDDCAIVIPKKYVSRRHAEIVEKNGRYLVRGLSGKNPILAEGREVKELTLDDGSEFEICGIRFKFKSKGKGANREERAKMRASSVVSNAISAPTTRFAGKDSGDDREASAPKARHTDDIDDGPLPSDQQDEETKQYESQDPDKNVKSGSSVKSGSGEGWRNDPKEGPRERIVFDDAAPSDVQKKSHKGSGEDKEERTDQIDISKFKPDDPFADKKESRTPEEIAAREKFIRALVGLGIAGILCAGALVWWLNRPQEKKVIDIEFHTPVGVNEVRRFEEALNENDPPNVVRETPMDGSPTDLVSSEDPNVATVEWAVPETKSTAFFLVRGVSPGETTFMIWLRSGNGRRYHVKVEGLSKHEILKKERMDKLAQLSGDELKKEIHDRIRQGEELDKALQTPGPKQERYPRQALHDYELAQEALDSLQKLIDKQGTTDPDYDSERTSVRTHLEHAEQEWRSQLARHKKDYDDCCRRKQWEEAVKELSALLWLVGDECDQNFMRWKLLMEKVFIAVGGIRVTVPDPACIEEQK